MVARVRLVSALGVLVLGGLVGACGDDSHHTRADGGAGRAGGDPEPSGAGGIAGGGMAGGGMGGRGSPSPLPPPATQLAPGSWCEADGWCWYNTLPNGNWLQAVAGAGRTDLWIAGEAAFPNTSASVLHFDGGRWSIVPTPLALTYAIWGASADDVWFVGDDGWFAGEGAIAHWDGSAITVAASVGMGSLTGVWGASATDIYAVGLDSAPLVEMPALHWDGSAWTPIPGVTGKHVTGSGPNDVWIGSTTGLLHFDGTSWSRLPALEGMSINALAAVGPGEVWLVASPAPGIQLVEHLDASGLSLSFQLDGFADMLVSMSASSRQNVWLVGDASGNDGYVNHYDGQTWTRAPNAPAALNEVASVPGFGDIAVGRVGEIVQLAADPTPRFSDLRSGLERDLAGVFGSSPSDMWAVGEAGTVLHYDGRAVNAVPSGTTARLNDVWGTGPGDVWAVGEAGTVLHYDGSAFGAVASGTTATLNAVFTVRPDDVWIGGDGPTLLHWDGSSMTPVTLMGANPGGAVYDLHGIAAGDIWLSGGGFGPITGHGYVAHFDGTAWSPVQLLTFASYGGLGVSQSFVRVWELAPDDVWVSAGQLELRGGGPDAYMHFDGTTWTQLLQDLTTLPQPEPPIVFPNRNRPSFVFGPHDRWLTDFFGIWKRNTN